MSFISLLVTGALFILGNCLLNLMLWQNFRTLRNPFLSLYWGVLGLVIATSCYYSGFSTVFILSVIPVIFLIRSGLRADAVSFKFVGVQILFISILHFVIALILQLFPYGANVENDMSFYANISEYLILNGSENTNHYFKDLLISREGNTIYHYFELWFNGLIGNLLSSSYTYLYLFKFFTLPLFIGYCMAGVVQIVPCVQRLTSLTLLYVVSLMVLIINFSPFINLGPPGWDISHHLLSRTIFIFYCFGLIPAFLALYRQSNYLQFTGYILIIPFISATTAPAIYAGTFLFVLITGIRSIISRKEILQLLALTATSALSFFIFYIITGGSSDSSKSVGSLSELFDSAISLWKAIIYQITTLTFRTFLFALFPLLLIYLLRKKILLTPFLILLLFALLVGISGIVIFQAIPTVDNAYQIPYVGYTAISVLLAFAVVLVFYNTHMIGRLVVLSGAGLLAVYTLIPRKVEVHWDESVSRNYLLQQGFTSENINMIDSVLHEIHESYFSAGFILTAPHARDFAIRKPMVWQLGQEFDILRNGMVLHPLTPLQDIRGNPEEWTNKSTDLKRLEFYNKDPGVDWKAHTNAYIAEHNLQFIFSDGPVEGLHIPVYIIQKKFME